MPKIPVTRIGFTYALDGFTLQGPRWRKDTFLRRNHPGVVICFSLMVVPWSWQFHRDRGPEKFWNNLFPTSRRRSVFGIYANSKVVVVRNQRGFSIATTPTLYSSYATHAHSRSEIFVQRHFNHPFSSSLAEIQRAIYPPLAPPDSVALGHPICEDQAHIRLDPPMPYVPPQ
jgi:hypothetical protein